MSADPELFSEPMTSWIVLRSLALKMWRRRLLLMAAADCAIVQQHGATVLCGAANQSAVSPKATTEHVRELKNPDLYPS